MVVQAANNRQEGFAGAPAMRFRRIPLTTPDGSPCHHLTKAFDAEDLRQANQGNRQSYAATGRPVHFPGRIMAIPLCHYRVAT